MGNGKVLGGGNPDTGIPVSFWNLQPQQQGTVKDGEGLLPADSFQPSLFAWGIPLSLGPVVGGKEAQGHRQLFQEALDVFDHAFAIQSSDALAAAWEVLEKRQPQSPQEEFEFLKRRQTFCQYSLDQEKTQFPIQERRIKAWEVQLDQVQKRFSTLKKATSQAARQANSPLKRLPHLQLWAAIAAEQKDFASLATALKRWQRTLEKIPVKFLKHENRLGQYAQILQTWGELHARATRQVPSVESKGLEKLDPTQLIGEMQRTAEYLEKLLPNASWKTSLQNLLRDGVEGDPINFLEMLDGKPLLAYVAQVVAADQTFSDAKAIAQPRERLDALGVVLIRYASLHQPRSVEEVLKVLEENFSNGISFQDRLQFQVQLLQVLGDWPEKNLLEKQVETWLEKVLSDASGTLTQQAERLLLIKEYYVFANQAPKAQGVETRLRTLQEKMEKRWTLLDASENNHEKLELAHAILQIDLACSQVPSAAQRHAIKSAEVRRQQERAGKVPLVQGAGVTVVQRQWQQQAELEGKRVVWLANLDRFQNALGQTTSLSAAERLAYEGDLLAALLGCRDLKQGEDFILAAELLDPRIAALRTAFETTAQEVFTKEFGEQAEAIHQDFLTRVQGAVEGKETGFFAAATSEGLVQWGRGIAALQPLVTFAQSFENSSLENRTRQGALFLMLGQVYYQAGLSSKAHGFFQRVQGLATGQGDGTDALAAFAKAWPLVQTSQWQQAYESLLPFAKHPLVGPLLVSIQQAHRTQRISEVLTILPNIGQNLLAKGDLEPDTLEEMTQDSQAAWQAVAKLMLRGETLSFSDAIGAVKASGRYPGFRTGFQGEGIGQVIQQDTSEYRIASAVENFLAFADNPLTLQDDYRENFNELLDRLKGDDYWLAVGNTLQTFSNHPSLGDWARSSLSSLPTEQLLRSSFSSLSILMPGSSSQWGADVFENTVTLVGSVGTGALLGGFGKKLFLSRFAGGHALADLPLRLRLGAWTSRSAFEATGFTLGHMGLKSAFSKSLDHWTLGNFATEFAMMMTTFAMVYGVGSGLNRLGKPMEKIPWFAAGAGQAAGLRAQGQWALNPWGRGLLGTTQWAGRVGAFGASPYGHEALGLAKMQGEVPYWAHFLGSIPMDFQFQAAGKVAHGAIARSAPVLVPKIMEFTSSVSKRWQEIRQHPLALPAGALGGATGLAWMFGGLEAAVQVLGGLPIVFGMSTLQGQGPVNNIQLLRSACKGNPSAYAQLLAKIGKPDEAVRLIEEVLRFHETGEVSTEELRYLSGVKQLDPFHRIELAKALWKAGRFSLLGELAPDHGYARNLLTDLAQDLSLDAPVRLKARGVLNKLGREDRNTESLLAMQEYYPEVEVSKLPELLKIHNQLVTHTSGEHWDAAKRKLLVEAVLTGLKVNRPSGGLAAQPSIPLERLQVSLTELVEVIKLMERLGKGSEFEQGSEFYFLSGIIQKMGSKAPEGLEALRQEMQAAVQGKGPAHPESYLDLLLNLAMKDTASSDHLISTYKFLKDARHATQEQGLSPELEAELLQGIAKVSGPEGVRIAFEHLRVAFFLLQTTIGSNRNKVDFILRVAQRLADHGEGSSLADMYYQFADVKDLSTDATLQESVRKVVSSRPAASTSNP